MERSEMRSPAFSLQRSEVSYPSVFFFCIVIPAQAGIQSIKNGSPDQVGG